MQNFHRHTSYSHIAVSADSAAMNEDYAKRAIELGHKIISSVEHGWQGYYFETFELAHKYNLKFVFGTEAYWVKDRLKEYKEINKETGEYKKNKNGQIIKSKDRSNHHIIILAKNENGRQAINDILSEANISGYYYKPRVDMELLLSLPPKDVVVTTACIAFSGYDDIDNIICKLHNHFKNNFMLEIQYHNTDKQKKWNAHLKELSEKEKIELIVGLDSHYIYPEESKLRDYVLAAKNINYEDEDGWYMDYPDDETVMNRFLEQNIFNKKEIQKAMDNTDICLTFDDYDDVNIFSKDIKLPTLYPNLTREEKEKKYSMLISKEFKKYIKNVPEEDRKKYFDGVKLEVDTYKATGMVDYPLMDYAIVKDAVEHGGLITDTGRGSAVGYFTNTLCGFSSVDRFTSPIKLYPERFISKTRILETHSLPDIDLNVGTPEIFEQAQINVLGEEHVSPMIAFGTFKKKSAFKLYARAKNMDFDLANTISEQIGKYDEALKYADDDERDTISIFDYVEEQYHDYIKQSESYWGIISDKKKAPSAYLLYQGNIRKEIGLIKCKSESTKKEYITCVIDGAIAENYKFLKNDILKVDVVLLIEKIFNRIGIKHFGVNELIKLVENDKLVWDLYGKGYTIGLNQCEKESTTKKCIKYKPKNISELPAFIAGIRPGFKSMYSKFESREPFSYNIPAFDKIIQTEQFPYSFIMYQEQTMNTLNYAGFPLDECYGIIKSIAKKHPEKVRPLKSRFIEGFKKQIIKDENMNEEEAQEASEKVWKIISDSCGYGFNSAHAYCMALDSLYNAWQKAHYPYEFYEVMLQHYSDKGNKDKVALIKKEMNDAFGIKEGQYKFRKDNRKFTADKENHIINPALLSIKSLNQNCADDLYELRNEKFNTFVDLLYKLKQTSVNAKQLDILIKLDYFSEFGDINELLYITNIYNELCDKVQLKKDKLSEFNLSEDIVRKFSENETTTRVDEIDCVKYIKDYNITDYEDCYKFKYTNNNGEKIKTTNGISTKKLIKKYKISEDVQLKYSKKTVIGRFNNINMHDLISYLFINNNIKKSKIIDKIKYQNEYLGFIYTKVSNLKPEYCFIQGYECKFKNPKLTLYRLCNGDIETVKIKRTVYDENPVNIGDVIKIIDMKGEGRWYTDGNDENGKPIWKQDKTNKEMILKKYISVK